ncbi:MAG TPA: DUF4349 domain-containing protein [Allosphingosinicella sp.]|nr:DUF4349 domain-containing protein [Allosphingosinicella sp.]
MTMNRPRLIAVLLCGLIVLILGYLIVAATAPQRYRFMGNPAALIVRESAMPAPPAALPPVEFVPADPLPVPARIVVAGPNVGPSAAPGVAFNYRYAFRLPAPRIAAVQEQHIQMCERLTLARCRITGMLYRVVNDRDIEATLALKVDPGIARLFGRRGVEAVVHAEGMLTESEIGGNDVAGEIRAAGRSLVELEASLARLEARLARTLSTEERGQLDYEARQLRDRIRSLRDSREAQQESLATTPMAFRYGSGDLVPGFARRPTIGQTMQRAGENFVDGATMLLIVLITLIPWLAALAVIWLVCRVVWRWLPVPAATAESA